MSVEELLRSKRDASINIVDLQECDIIDGTPQKVLRKKRRKPQPKSFIKHSDTDFCVSRNSNPYLTLHSTSHLNNSTSKSPYVFFEIKEVLTFTKSYQPVNPNIKVFGLFSQSKMNEYQIMEHHNMNNQNIKAATILVDVKLMESFPAIGQPIVAHGFLRFGRFPIFAMKFWLNVTYDSHKYLEYLRKQKLYVPNCYTEVKRIEEPNESVGCFDEIDDSCLNRKLESLEACCKMVNRL